MLRLHSSRAVHEPRRQGRARASAMTVSRVPDPSVRSAKNETPRHLHVARSHNRLQRDDARCGRLRRVIERFRLFDTIIAHIRRFTYAGVVRISLRHLRRALRSVSGFEQERKPHRRELSHARLDEPTIRPAAEFRIGGMAAGRAASIQGSLRPHPKGWRSPESFG
jgi:hypothetical protein